ncbi:MAG: hypothetical protein ACOZE5_16975 [Verrucomicrobiota bacterium]
MSFLSRIPAAYGWFVSIGLVALASLFMAYSSQWEPVPTTDELATLRSRAEELSVWTTAALAQARVNHAGLEKHTQSRAELAGWIRSLPAGWVARPVEAQMLAGLRLERFAVCHPNPALLRWPDLVSAIEAWAGNDILHIASVRIDSDGRAFGTVVVNLDLLCETE